MERPLITAVTHSTDEARITLLGVPDHPGHRRADLHRARRRQHERRHDHPERAGVRGRGGGHVVHRPALGRAAGARDARPVVAEVGIARVADDPGWARSPSSGAGMKSHPGVAAKVFSTLGREGINIEMISTSPIKISCVVQADQVTTAVKALHEAFELGADDVRAEHPFEQSARDMSHRVAVVGATGAVGTVMLAKLRERSFPAREIVPFALGALGRPRAGGLRHGPAAVRRDDPGLRPRDLQRRRDDVGRVGEAVRRRGLRRRRQLLALAPRRRRPARGERGQPARARAPPRPDRQPELLDDAADGRAQADPRRRRDRAADRLDLPVGLGHRREGGRGARGADATPCCSGDEPPAPAVYPHPIAFNVLGGAGNFKDGDDYTDEERKMMFETRKILEAPDIGISVTCARVPGHRRALGVGQPADARRDRARRGARAAARRARRRGRRRPGEQRRTRPRSPARAATRCSSAGSGATRRTRARSTCGSWATTC